VKELFHGSRNANILGILTKGLLIAPANVPSTGYMFGRGLYFANRSTKSTQYSVGRYNGGNNGRDNAFLFLADVAVGKMKEYDSGHYQDYAPHGYDSVKGVAGRQLLHDEFIVYNVSQARIKYVVDFKLK
jgi:poly [ADP-ribose] polymerase